ncbi:MAG TPA: membrane-bound O-acyltransferase family protein, partial [Armatimonadota bacterium]|nr:membrane-bound O-acyltransferase family protein [Armatimonadota bacterium]
MVFPSHVFLFYFLPVALGLYYLCPARWRGLLLIGLSYLCYGWANPWFVLLLVF